VTRSRFLDDDHHASPAATLGAALVHAMRSLISRAALFTRARGFLVKGDLDGEGKRFDRVRAKGKRRTMEQCRRSSVKSHVVRVVLRKKHRDPLLS